MSADLAPYLKHIVIDEKHEFAPARARKVGEKSKLIYSDHFPHIVEFENLPKGWIAKEKTSSWNQNKPNGWERYKKLTDNASVKIKKIL